MSDYVINTNAKVIEEQNEKIYSKATTGQASFDPKNYLNLKLDKNQNNKTVRVRLLPISATDNGVFFEVNTHSCKLSTDIAKSGFKTFVCLNDPHIGSNDCPFCKRAKELFDKAAACRESNNELSKTYFKQACSYKKKKTYIVRVIDRDHEAEGVKFWRFNENSLHDGVYDKLMALYYTRRDEYLKSQNKEYNIFDLMEGKDIVINITKSLISDGHGGVKEKTALNITDAGLPTPLSEDVELANKWILDSKTWKDVYSNKTVEYLQLIVDGKKPVYDKESGIYIDSELLQDAHDQAIKKSIESDEILKENPTEVILGVSTPDTGQNTAYVTEEEDEDLPF